MMEIQEIKKQETRTKRIFIPVTPTEHKKLKTYCREKEVKFSDLIRFALKQTIGF